MSQHDFEIANQGFPSFRSDLNSALQALASNSAGTSEPSTTFAYQFWYDSTANLLKFRNADNDAWITLAFFDQTNDEWEVRTAVIQAVDSAGVVIKTDDGTTRITVADNGNVTFANDVTVTGDFVKSGAPHSFNRTGSDGNVITIEKDGTTVGEFGSTSGKAYITLDTRSAAVTGSGLTGGDGAIFPSDKADSLSDADISLGGASTRFKDLYLSGGVYLGGTGAANYLDDYEEGTWSPAFNNVTGDLAASDLDFNVSGFYTKIGNTVHARCSVATSGAITGTDSGIIITGLPFTSSGSSFGSPPFASPNSGAFNMGSVHPVMAGIGDGATQLDLYKVSGGRTPLFVKSDLYTAGGNANSYTFSIVYTAS